MARRSSCRDRRETWSKIATTGRRSKGRVRYGETVLSMISGMPNERPNRRHLRDREGDQLRVGDRLGVIGPGAGVDRLAEVLWVAGSTKRTSMPWSSTCSRTGSRSRHRGRSRRRFCLPPARCSGSKRPRPPARSTTPAPRRRLRAPRRAAPGVVRRIHEARIDVPELLQPEQVRGVLGALELIGGRLEDRHGDRARRGIGAPTGVKRPEFQPYGDIVPSPVLSVASNSSSKPQCS